MSSMPNDSRSAWHSMRSAVLVGAALMWLAGCGGRDDRSVITVWHPMRPTAERDVFYEELRQFEKLYPGYKVQALYKETEELRSDFQAAALAGEGPDLVYGPSDVLDAYHTMGLLQDMAPWYTDEQRADFIKGALTYLPALVDPTKHELVQIGDRFGNHLSLIYNRRFVKEPPKTTDELIEFAKANTIDSDGDGRKERYGLVWSYVEPYFAIPFLTGHGAWVFADRGRATADDRPVPALDTPESVAAYRFMQSLRDEYKVVPGNCDYELADSLFKSGRAAMIINGDWSWVDYLANPDIDAAVAILPVVSSTGLPMKPMIMPKGFSLSANAKPDAAAAAMALVRHMTSPGVQRRIAEKLRMIPARLSVYEDSLSSDDPTYRVSQAQRDNTRLMPVTTELRGVWDAMRPEYQAVLAGATTPDSAAAAMQRGALSNIEVMHRVVRPDRSGIALRWLGLLLLFAWMVWQRENIVRFFDEWPRNRVAYLFALPALAVVFLVIVFPLGYNVALSLSNMSLIHFRDWQIVGLQNYWEVMSDPRLGGVLLKTVVWTVVGVAFHVVIGLALAAALFRPIAGRTVYQLLLILPWAIPAYITALTWRGMFSYEYGAINLILERLQEFPPIAWVLQVLHLTPPVNWLGDAAHAFQACIVTNVWLGFPFMMIVALGGMQAIPQELYEAARMDRAGGWQQFRHITLPLLKPVIIPAITLSTLWTFNNLNVVWLVSNGGQPQDSTHILVSYVYKSVFNLYRYGYGAALSMLMFAVLMAFALVFISRSRASESVYG